MCGPRSETHTHKTPIKQRILTVFDCLFQNWKFETHFIGEFLPQKQLISFNFFTICVYFLVVFSLCFFKIIHVDSTTHIPQHVSLKPPTHHSESTVSTSCQIVANLFLLDLAIWQLTKLCAQRTKKGVSIWYAFCPRAYHTVDL